MAQKPWQKTGFRSLTDYLVKQYASKNCKIDIISEKKSFIIDIISEKKSFRSIFFEDWKLFCLKKYLNLTYIINYYESPLRCQPGVGANFRCHKCLSHYKATIVIAEMVHSFTIP